MKALLVSLLVACGPFGGVAEQAPAALRAPSEHEVRAAFLFHFAQLVSWPGEAGGAAAPLVVAVVGRDPFEGWLERTLAGRVVRERSLLVVHARSLAELPAVPDIVVAGDEQLREVRPILARLRGRPVLTVGVARGFARAGGMIEFRITPDQRVAFDVNLRETEAAGLRMSSQLLRIARIVGGES